MEQQLQIFPAIFFNFNGLCRYKNIIKNITFRKIFITLESRGFPKNFLIFLFFILLLPPLAGIKQIDLELEFFINSLKLKLYIIQYFVINIFQLFK